MQRYEWISNLPGALLLDNGCYRRGIGLKRQLVSSHAAYQARCRPRCIEPVLALSSGLLSVQEFNNVRQEHMVTPHVVDMHTFEDGGESWRQYTC